MFVLCSLQYLVPLWKKHVVHRNTLWKHYQETRPKSASVNMGEKECSCNEATFSKIPENKFYYYLREKSSFTV